MKPKSLIIECIIVIAIYALAFFCWSGLFGVVYSGALPTYDRYSIPRPSPPQSIILVTFCIISTLVYFTRAIINRYKNNVVNTVLIVCDSLSLIALIMAYPMVADLEKSIFVNGDVLTFKMASPLVPVTPPSAHAEHPHLGKYLIILTVIFLLILVASSIITWRNRKTNRHAETTA